jgi:hypothetical protein
MLETIEQRTAGMKKQAQELIEQAYQRGYKAGQENALTVDSNKFREQGRNEAWEAARKIVLSEVGGLSGRDLSEIFDATSYLRVLGQYSATEAIKKIKTYEEQKKQEEDSEIHVGDEVCAYGDIIGIVTYISKTEEFSILWRDGSVGKRKNISDFRKTGRHFPEIAEVLKKLKEAK